MDRIIGANTIDLGGGRRGFRGKDTVAGVPGTELAATWHNAIQEEVVGLIELGPEDPSNAETQQLGRLIQSGILNHAVAGGSANAWTVDLPLAPLAYLAGMPLEIVAPATNTDPVVNCNIEGLGNRRLKKRSGADPAIGDLIGGAPYRVIVHGADLVVMTTLPSDVGAALQAEGGRILNYRVYTLTARQVITALLNPGIVLWTGTYPKLKDSTRLIFEASPSLRLADTNSTTYARARLNATPGTDQFQNHYLLYNNSGASYQTPQVNKFSWTGIAKGNVAVEYRVGQATAINTTVVINPSALDSGGWTDGFTSTFTLYEVE